MQSPNVLVEKTPIKNSRGDEIMHLTIDHVIWMSNDDEELDDIDRAIEHAKGDCYVGGLGLGVIVNELAKKESVKSITVVEINPHIIKLIKPYLFLKKTKVYEADARYIYRPNNNCPEKYDFMYFDLWLEPDITGWNMMQECFQNSKKYLKKNGVLEAWMKNQLERGELWT